MTAVDGEGYSPNAKKYIAADEPKEAVFDSLTGGTEYTVNVFTFNGSMDSDPVTLTVATSKWCSVNSIVHGPHFVYHNLYIK